MEEAAHFEWKIAKAAAAYSDTSFLVREEAEQAARRECAQVTTEDLRLILAHLRDVVIRGESKYVGIAIARGCVIAERIDRRGLYYFVFGVNFSNSASMYRLAALDDVETPPRFGIPRAPKSVQRAGSMTVTLVKVVAIVVASVFVIGGLAAAFK